ncbi:hypothetical protein BFJ63_vAg18591 [Fusarium oxysporum f. sp. narcissi]|uniref:Uncharacterized protein n=1 Tax=Fusarium oxysporum f. sp. narcissi TaxID=451672 RepID=A0A4Q2V2L1_FUSOX|nr:hypothetical protein BFJ63_vAg18591 [Fusarium oxysporum f. sp. narcissi]
MPTVNPDIDSETPGANGDSLSLNAEVKRRRLIQQSVRKPAAKIKKKKQSKKIPPRGSVRHFPCRQCVARASKSPGHECASQDNTGAACWDCAKNGHTCRPVPTEAQAAVRAFWDLNRQLSGTDEEPDEVWRGAAQRAAQQLRACGTGAAPPPTTRPAPALASFGEVAERSFEERKLIALETIAGAAQLWIRLNQPDEEGDDEGEEDD